MSIIPFYPDVRKSILVLIVATAWPAISLPAEQNVAELPRVSLNTSMPPSSGRILAVSSGCKDLQAQINAARPGDIVEIPAGDLCIGNYILPKKMPASGWVLIRTANAEASFPQNVRVSPANASRMAKLITPNAHPAVATVAGANHYRLVGLEIGVQSTPQPSINYGIVTLGDATKNQNSLDQVPSDLVIDRCYIHGNPTLNVSRGVSLNSARTAVIDSYISEIHGQGFDTQALCGWNGPGPFKILNNYLEASGENILFGGATGFIPQIIPSDIEIRGNYFFKPLSWNPKDPSYAGKHWTVKNILELKNAQRALIDGNVLMNNWDDAQVGYAVLFTVRTEQGEMPWNAVQDITFTNNLLRNSPGGVDILGADNNGGDRGKARGIVIRNNRFEKLVRGAGFLLLNGAEDVTIDHNTVLLENGRWAVMFDGKPHVRLTYTNNLVSQTQYDVYGSGAGTGQRALDRYAPKATYRNNLILKPSDQEAAGGQKGSGADMLSILSATRTCLSGRPADNRINPGKPKK